MEYYEFRAMNSDILLGAEKSAADLGPAFEEAANLIRALEARLTRFSETSELAELNRSAGSWFSASEELYTLVRAAREYHVLTDRLFDPSVLPALELAGYDKSMDEVRAHGVSARGENSFLVRDIPAADFSAVQFDDGAHALLLPYGMRVDLGGIAKGWIAERAAEKLATQVRACVVDAGGDMFMIGCPRDGDVWRVGLEDPLDPEHTLAVLRTGPGAIATSSVMRRRWSLGGITQHHLIDPRRGTPAESAWLSVTVVAPHAAAAEVFAKALLIAGPDDAAALADRNPEIAFIAVDHEARLWGSQNAKGVLDAGS